MLLAIDIGNTNITFGIFSGKKLLKKFDIPTDKLRYATLKKELGRFKPREAVICSVVPGATRHLKGVLSRLSLRPLIIGKDVRVPIKNLYRKPAQVGQDRLVNAYAVTRLYGAPAVIVDFGTAITFDVVSKNKEYKGGLIVPGLKISLEALFQRTALLPQLGLGAPREFIGKDTKSSMLSGIVYGFASLTDQLLTQLKKDTGKGALALATGGDVSLMARYCRKIDRIDGTLTLKGLNLIYGEAKKNT
ncbi:MAG: type III pantothenate kinase [Candidatus Omnitrophota bacterium]